MACYRVNFTFTFNIIISLIVWLEFLWKCITLAGYIGSAVSKVAITIQATIKIRHKTLFLLCVLRMETNITACIQFTYILFIYTGCPRRNGQNFGRVFLMLNYTDITQNTYIQSWTVTEIMAWEKCGYLAFPRTVRLQLSRIDLDSAIKAVISVTVRAPPNTIRQYFITARYSCTMESAW